VLSNDFSIKDTVKFTMRYMPTNLAGIFDAHEGIKGLFTGGAAGSFEGGLTFRRKIVIVSVTKKSAPVSLGITTLLYWKRANLSGKKDLFRFFD
jgi:hypothetical protein